MEASLFTCWLRVAFSLGPAGHAEALSFPGQYGSSPAPAGAAWQLPGAGWTLREKATSSV